MLPSESDDVKLEREIQPEGVELEGEVLPSGSECCDIVDDGIVVVLG